MQLEYFKYDLYRYFYPDDKTEKVSFSQKARIILTTQGVWATFVYRVRRYAKYECNNYLVKTTLKAIFFILFMIIEVLTGIHIQPEIEIGPGFYIGHFGNIFLGGNTKIGKLCNISHECTVGYAGRGDKWGLPEIGDFVYIAPGAKIFGKIKVGNHVAIGANAVVTKDVPDNAVAVGVPAKIINYNTSKDMVVYNKSKFKDILGD